MYPCTLSMHTHIPALSHIYIYILMPTYMYAYIQAYIYVDMTMYVRMHICVYVFFPEYVHILNNNIKKKGSQILFYLTDVTIFYCISEFASNQLLVIVLQMEFCACQSFQAILYFKSNKIFQDNLRFHFKSTLNVEQRLVFLGSKRAH